MKAAVLPQCVKSESGYVFTNVRTHTAYTVNVTPMSSRKLDALDSFAVAGQNLAERKISRRKRSGGRQEARTPDLRVANAALSQLS